MQGHTFIISLVQLTLHIDIEDISLLDLDFK